MPYKKQTHKNWTPEQAEENIKCLDELMRLTQREQAFVQSLYSPPPPDTSGSGSTITSLGTARGDEIVDEILRMMLAIEESKPILYYATSDRVTEGKVILSEKTDVTPRFIVCNPSDIDRIKREYIGVRLVHLRDRIPEEVQSSQS